MFMNVEELRFGEAAPFQSSTVALHDLQAMYRDILGVVKHEAQIIEAVFPNTSLVMQMFLQRLMEQQVRQNQWSNSLMDVLQ